jgi:peptidoglycan/xylan/chitin deacetylase (PgdA/CDA1 family)
VWACKAACALIFSILAGSCRIVVPVSATGPVICFTFDDQHISIWEHAYPVMKQHGFRGTNFVNSGRIGHPNLMDWQKLETLGKDEGWETGGHTLYHQDLPELSFGDAELAILADYDSLKAHGLNPRSFALPGGDCPLEYYPILQRRYKNIRGSSDFAMFEPINRFSLGYLPFQSGWTADNIIHRLQAGIANGEAIIIIGFHRIETPTGGYNDNCPLAEFIRILDWVHSKGLEVLTVSEAVDLF